MYAVSVERTLRPGGPGALAAQRHYEQLAPTYDRLGSTAARYRGLASSITAMEDGDEPQQAMEDDGDFEQPVWRSTSGTAMNANEVLAGFVRELLHEAQQIAWCLSCNGSGLTSRAPGSGPSPNSRKLVRASGPSLGRCVRDA